MWYIWEMLFLWYNKVEGKEKIHLQYLFTRIVEKTL